MYVVYILISQKDHRTYVGYTDNFSRRFKQHNSGHVTSTRYRIPFKLLLKEKFLQIRDAKRREVWWKSGAGRKELKKMFKNLQT
jgi:putative endonuclease